MKTADIRIMTKEDFYNMKPNTIAFYDENDTFKTILDDLESNHMVIHDIVYNEFSTLNKVLFTIIVKEI